MLSFPIADTTVTVESIGTDFDLEFRGNRQRYAYSIVTPEWRYDGDDIRSGCHADVDEADAARTLFSFLSASAEAYESLIMRNRPSDNGGLFPPHVAEWAYMNSDELSMLSLDPEDIDA